MPISSDFLSNGCIPPTALKAWLSTSTTPAKTGELAPGSYYVTNVSSVWAFVAVGPNASAATIVEYGVVSKGIPVGPGSTITVELDSTNDAVFCDLASGTGNLAVWQPQRSY
jgi:hypothetical protein